MPPDDAAPEDSAAPSVPPPEVVALADRRVAARQARDFPAADELRDRIAAAGWRVRDTAQGWSLDALPPPPAAPPFPRVPTVRDLPDRSAEPDGRRCTVAVLVDDWPDDGWADEVRTCVAAVLAHAPDHVGVLLLDNGSSSTSSPAAVAVHALATAAPDRVEELHVERPAGWGEAVTALLRADTAQVQVLLDPSSVLQGDALTPLLDCFADPAVAAAGWRGVRVRPDWSAFDDAGTGEVEALLGYLLAVRRRAAAEVPPPVQARLYRNADLEWSFRLRDAGGRLVVPAQPMPVRQDRHRGWSDTDPALLEREARRTYRRFLSRFRGREDLRLP